jgi:undecaprenyl-diphosphatase
MNSGVRQKLLELDAQYTNRLSIAERPGVLRSLAALFAHSGDSWFWLLGLVLVWWLGPDPWKELAITMMIGVVLTAAVVFLIKFTVRRRRPDGEWGKIYRKTDPHSFPSGHATRATMLAIVAIGFGSSWFALVICLWAPLVILARVAMGVHYLSDVLAGAMLGIALGVLTIIVIR